MITQDQRGACFTFANVADPVPFVMNVCSCGGAEVGTCFLRNVESTINTALQILHSQDEVLCLKIVQRCSQRRGPT